MNDDTHGMTEVHCVLEKPLVGLEQDNEGLAVALVVNNIVSIRFKADEA